MTVPEVREQPEQSRQALAPGEDRVAAREAGDVRDGAFAKVAPEGQEASVYSRGFPDTEDQVRAIEAGGVQGTASVGATETRTTSNAEEEPSLRRPEFVGGSDGIPESVGAIMEQEGETSSAEEGRFAGDASTEPAPEVPSEYPSVYEQAQMEPPLEAEGRAGGTRRRKSQPPQGVTQRLGPRAGDRQSPRPIKRGGRSRSQTLAAVASEQQSAAESPYRADIICWEESRRWFVGVEVASDGVDSFEVMQNGFLLDEHAVSRYQLHNLQGNVLIRNTESHADGARELVCDHSYLIFKLVKGGQEGRQVRHTRRGLYLVVVPDSWTWDEEPAVQLVVAPEPTSIEGFQAYLFEVGTHRGSTIIFLTQSGERQVVPSEKERFRLEGNLIPDFTERVGPLFGSAPPKVVDDSAESWSDVITLVIGREGPGSGRWRTEFRPQPAAQHQELPEQVRRRMGGWYFIRIYDTGDHLLESLDFRFMSALKAVVLSEHPSLPNSGKHEPVRLEFVHDPGCSVTSTGPPSSYLHLEKPPESTIVQLPADPAWDRTRWRVEAKRASVEMTVATRRVWWAASDEDTEPSAWGAEAIDGRPVWFAATSNTSLWLRLPVARLVDKVQVGFRRETARLYSIPVSQERVAIPLREFGDCSEVEELSKEQQLRIWLGTQARGTGTVVVRILPRFVCRLGCSFVTTDEKQMQSHVAAAHTSLVQAVKGYRELLSLLPELNHLPSHIYKCCYCPFWHSDVDRIVHHIEDECEHADRSAGKTQISFKALWDAAEVRREVFQSLPEVYKCYRGCVLVNPGEKEIIGHLLDRHKRDLYRCE